MPPNMTKIFYHWGMEDKIKNIGAVSEGVLMSRSESYNSAGTFVPVLTDHIFLSGDSIHTWHTSLGLRDAGGGRWRIYLPPRTLMLPQYVYVIY